jgi:hypothetical protein
MDVSGVEIYYCAENFFAEITPWCHITLIFCWVATVFLWYHIENTGFLFDDFP